MPFVTAPPRARRPSSPAAHKTTPRCELQHKKKHTPKYTPSSGEPSSISPETTANLDGASRGSNPAGTLT
eukprot:2997820-Heterocapsa_arctica.AAC.1